MITKKCLSLLSLALIASPLMAATPKLAVKNEEPTEAQERLQNFIKYGGAASLAAVGAGFLMKNNMLKGIGLGGASGLACAHFQNDIHWMLAWLGESIGRSAVARMIATPVTDAQFAAEEDTFPFNLIDNDAQKRTAMTTAKVSSPAWASSWVSYLIYRSLENKVKAENAQA